MFKPYNALAAFLVLLLSLALACGDDSSTGPDPEPPFEASLLLNRVSVSLVPGMSDNVTILSHDGWGEYDSITVELDNDSVLSFSVADSIISFTALAYGTATLTVTTAGGLTTELPVRVYDPTVLDTGELLVKVVDEFYWRWDDLGSGGDNDGSYWHPKVPEEYHALGSAGKRGYSTPTHNTVMLVVKDKGTSAIPPLAAPTDYQLVYNDAGSGANADGSFWLPLPPQGYVAIGIVAQSGWSKPSLDDVVCVREDLTILAEAGSYIWHDVGTGANNDFSSYQIDPPDAGPHSGLYLKPGTFVATSLYQAPAAHPCMNVLKVNLPLLEEAPYQTFVPQLTGYTEPPEETVPLFARAMIIPMNIVSDPLYAGNQHWRVVNSPFYRLERHVYYKRLYHNYNQTSEVQNNAVTIRSGVTTTESESFWNETSISVTVEGGVSIKFFEGKVSTTISTSFGYETQTSVAVLQETEITSTVNTSPGKAATLWQQYNRYVLKRHNGTSFEPVSAWEFGINSYVTDEYPNEN